MFLRVELYGVAVANQTWTSWHDYIRKRLTMGRILVSALSEHPTVKRFYELNQAANASHSENGKGTLRSLDAQWLRQLALSAGADDVGFVHIDCPELAP